MTNAEPDPNESAMESAYEVRPYRRQSAALANALRVLNASANCAESHDDDEDYAMFTDAGRQLREAFNLADPTATDNPRRAEIG